MTHRLALAALFLAACGAPTATAPHSAEAARAACREAFAAVDTASDLGPAVEEIFERCADLHAAPACREAWRAAAEVTPDARIAVVAAGCRRAYCGDLEPPRPVLCDHPIEGVPPSVLGEEWAALERRVITLEHGEDGAPFARVVAHLAPGPSIPIDLPPAAEPAATVTLAIQRDGVSLVVTRVEATEVRAVLSDGASAEIDAEALRPLLVDVDRVAIAADESTPYGDVIRVIDAVRAAGVQDFAIVAEPDEESAP